MMPFRCGPSLTKGHVDESLASKDCGKSEVSQPCNIFAGAFFRDQDVLGLYISMNDFCLSFRALSSGTSLTYRADAYLERQRRFRRIMLACRS